MKAINYHEMGIRIRKQRELLGYTREQFAEKLDVSTKFCSDIELGVKGVSIQTLAKLTELLHLSSDYILFGECIQGDSMELEMLSNCFVFTYLNVYGILFLGGGSMIVNGEHL